ncbi:MAG: RagB/SusD family nutrient uptake outer membrane protein, partial [Flavobacterium sp.]
MKKFSKYILLFVAAAAVTSCDDYLDITPVGVVIPETLEQYRAVLTTGYDIYPEHKSLTAVRTDELTMNEFSDEINVYKDIYIWKDANPDRFTATIPYQNLYTVIFYTNVIINDAQQKLTESPEKTQLVGEAYALRAMAYFDLINLFGKPYNTATATTDKGVPLALEIDLEQVFVPQSVEVIYNQFKLPIEYHFVPAHKVRTNNNKTKFWISKNWLYNEKPIIFERWKSIPDNNTSKIFFYDGYN